VIPRFGAVSLLPLPGVIDNRTPFAAAPDPLPTLAWLPPWLAAAVEPPEQPAASNPSVAQTATAASPWPRSPEDRKEMACEMAAGRHFEPTDCTDTAYALQAGTVRVRHGKGDRSRTVGLDQQTAALLARWLDRRKQLGPGARAPVFCTLAGGRINTSYVAAGP